MVRNPSLTKGSRHAAPATSLGFSLMSTHFDVEHLRNEIAHLIYEFPELGTDSQLKSDMIEGETSFDNVVDILLRERRTAITMMSAIEDEMDSLGKRQDRYSKRCDKIRDIIFRLMQDAGMKRLERPTATLTINEGKPSVMTNEKDLPEKYFRITKTPNKALITADLKAGVAVPGAQWNNAPPYLTVRTT
jgi:hypothetical protein